MSKKQKIYCKIGQAVCEGTICFGIGAMLALMVLSKLV